MKMDVFERKVRSRTESPKGNGFLMNRTVTRIPLHRRGKTKPVKGFFGITIFK